MSWADYWASLSDAQNYYESDPTGSGPNQGDTTSEGYGQPITTHYNPSLFATGDTSQALASQVGGEVIAAPLREAGGGTPGSPWTMPDANYIRMPNGAIVNAGTLQGYINAFGPQLGGQMVAQEIAGDTTQGLANQGVDLSYWNNQFANNPAIQPPAPPPLNPAAQAGLDSFFSGRGGGSVTGRGGVPTSRTAPPTTQPTSQFSPGTTRIGPPITPPGTVAGMGNPAGSSGKVPGIQYPPSGLPTTSLPAGSGGTPVLPGRGGLPGGGIPPVTHPPIVPGGGNPAFQFPQGDFRGWSTGVSQNPYTSGVGTNGSGIPYTLPSAQGAATNPFGSAVPTTQDGTSQILQGGTASGGGADDWLSNTAIGSTDALSGFANGSNSFLQQLANGKGPNQDALQSMISGKGNPINQTPAWDAMVAAQQHNIGEGQARLNEQFNVGGGRFSTAFGTAAADYNNQAVLDQNSLLAQMTAQAGESAQGRLLNAGSTLAGLGQQGLSTAAGISSGAAGQLGQLGFQGASQLSNQDFQSIMQQYGISADMAKYMAGGADQASSQLAGYGAGASNAIYGGSLAGANSLFGAENNAAQSMFGAQNSLFPSFMNNALQTQQQGLGAAGDLSNLWNANLQTGSQIGQQQYGIGQNEINNAYQQWLYQQPTNNPLLSMMFSGATGYPQMYNPTYQPGQLGEIMKGVGSMAGAAAAFSDIRLKENIVPIGHVKDLPLYSYNFIGSDQPEIGFMAQEVYQKYPQAVIKGDDRTPWMIKTDHLSQLLKGRL